MMATVFKLIAAWLDVNVLFLLLMVRRALP